MTDGPETPIVDENPLHPKLSWRTWFQAAKAVFMNMNDMNLGLISAGVAFYSMLAIFPAIAAIIALWGFVADPAVVAGQVEMLETFVPPDAFGILTDQIDALLSANSSTLGWTTVISTGAALWLARAGVAALIRGLNAIYRERNRAGLRHVAAAIGVTLMLIGVAFVALASVVVLPIMTAFLPLGPWTATTLAVVRWAAAVAVIVLALGVVYRYGPNRRGARLPWITPGALVAVAIWAAGSYALSFYISNFGRYNEIYGALGAVVALLIWLYLSAFVVLLGAALNVELELRTRRDSTTGRRMPRGQRGAVAADTYLGANADPLDDETRQAAHEAPVATSMDAGEPGEDRS